MNARISCSSAAILCIAACSAVAFPTTAPAGDMLVADCVGHSIHRYDIDGNYVGEFVPALATSLRFPHSMIWGPDGNGDGIEDVYVAGLQSNAIHRYDGVTGEPIGDGVFSRRGQIVAPVDLDWGPDRNGDGVADLYVLNNVNRKRLVWVDGVTGARGGVLIFDNTARYTIAEFMTFGPDTTADGTPEIYMTTGASNTIYKFDGASGAFIENFSRRQAGYLTGRDLLFHTDGRLYVCNGAGNGIVSVDATTGRDGLAFVPSGSGGLANPHGIIFGHDANGDGIEDLYVAGQQSITVTRYDGLTGEYIDMPVSPNEGGITAAASILFMPDPPCTGDIDRDGGVGLSDLAVVLSNFGTPDGATPADGDLDSDGDVDLADLGIMLSAFGSTCS